MASCIEASENKSSHTIESCGLRLDQTLDQAKASRDSSACRAPFSDLALSFQYGRILAVHELRTVVQALSELLSALRQALDGLDGTTGTAAVVTKWPNRTVDGKLCGDARVRMDEPEDEVSGTTAIKRSTAQGRWSWKRQRQGQRQAEGQGQGNGKPMPDTGEPGRRSPPSLATLPAPPTSAGVLLPKSQPAPQDAPSEEMKLLQALAPHLGQLDGLPTALKEQLAGFSDMTHKQEAKALQSLVSRRNKAKAEVERIRADRAGYEATWVAYITQLQELLSTQFQQRSEVLSEFAEAEAAWVATLRETGGALQKAGENPAELVQAINLESDMEDVQKYDPVAVHKANAAEIELGQKQLHEALAVMQATAQHGARRDGSRTPRRQADSGSVSSPDPWTGNPAKVQKVTEAAKASAPMPLADGEAASSAAKEKSKALLPFGKPPT